MNLPIKSLYLAGITLISAVVGQAQTTQFTSRADWLANVNVTLSDNFESYNWSDSGGDYLGSSINLGNFSYSSSWGIYGIDTDILNYDAGFWTGKHLDLEGGWRTISFSGPRTAIAFDFGEFRGNPTDFTFTLNNISGTSIQLSSPEMASRFFGITSTEGFSSLTINSSNPYVILDNLAVGDASTVTPVPEPSTYAVSGAAGLALLVALRKRRKK